VQGDLVLQQAARVRSEFGKSHIVESDISFFNASRKTFLRLPTPVLSRVSWYVVDTKVRRRRL